MPDETPKTVRFRFEQDPGYRLIPVNGVWGGPLPAGDVRIELFYERQATPEWIERSLDKDSRLGPILHRKPAANEYVRTVLVGVMLTPEKAISIGEFLIEKGMMARKRSGGDAED